MQTLTSVKSRTPPSAPCANCGGNKFTSADERQTRHIDGHVVELSVRVDRCAKCGQAVWSQDAADEFEEKFVQKVATHGPPSGTTFRMLRNALNLRSTEVAFLFNVAPETITRWERGQRDVDIGAWFAMCQWVLRRQRGEDGVEEARNIRRAMAGAPADATTGRGVRRRQRDQRSIV